MSYLTYLIVGWVFLHEIWPRRRAHYMNYENINNSNLDGMSLASFCQSRAVYKVSFLCFLVFSTPISPNLSKLELFHQSQRISLDTSALAGYNTHLWRLKVWPVPVGDDVFYHPVLLDSILPSEDLECSNMQEQFIRKGKSQKSSISFATNKQKIILKN